MGFFNNIKNMIKRNKKLKSGNRYNTPQDVEYLTHPVTMRTSEYGDYSMITSIKFDTQMRYSDGMITNLMIAKIQTGIEGKLTNFGEYDNVAFEIPVGYPIDETIMQKIISYHLYQKAMPDNRECMYIGKLNHDPNYYYIDKDIYTENYVKGPISNKIRRENQIAQEQINNTRNQREIYSKQKDNQFKERMKYDADMIEKEEEEKRNRRKDNYYLEFKDSYYAMDNKKYESYDGVNVVNGKMIQIRKLNKVARNKNGTCYIYTGYIRCKGNEYGEEVLTKDGMLDTPLGVPVVFTTDKKIEDVALIQESQEVYNLLYLLSQEDNFKNDNGYLNYIGSLSNRNGTLDKNESNMPGDIQQKIYELKQQFYQNAITGQANDSQIR